MHPSMPSETERTLAIRHALVAWFLREGKDYPWRRTTDPWAILVSEIMLQQTTIPTVLGRYEAWLRQYPTPAHLAAASEEEALRSWEGLGYYRRVRSLQATAKAIAERHGGNFPQNPDDLRQLPGIGDYTSGAVLSFAYNIAAPIVDANVSRVQARLDNDPTPIDSTEGRKRHWKRAAELLDPDNPRAYNSAIMELGQTYCTPTSPDCLLCPCREHCLAENPASLPVKTPRPETLEETHHDILCLTGRGILMEPQTNGRHLGMYRLPRRTADETRGMRKLGTQKYGVTRYKITRLLYQAPPDTEPRATETFVSLDALPSIPMASPDRKIILKHLPQGN